MKLQRPLPVAKIVRAHASPRSKTTTDAPYSAAATAAASPAAPPPTTATSQRAGTRTAAAAASASSRARDLGVLLGPRANLRVLASQRVHELGHADHGAHGLGERAGGQLVLEGALSHASAILGSMGSWPSASISKASAVCWRRLGPKG